MEEPDDDSQCEERTSMPAIEADETGMTRADPGLRQRYPEGEEQNGSEEEGGAPAEAQEEHRREERDEQVPLRRQGRGPSGTAGLVEGLERRRAPDALVDASSPGREVEGPPFSVEASDPAQLPGRVVPRGPFAFQEGFRLAVSHLLLPEPADGGAAVVPDDRDIGSIAEGEGEESEPMEVRIRVVVDERDDPSRRGPDPDVPGGAKPLVLRRDEAHAVFRGDLRRRIRGPVVDDDHLEVRIVEVLQAGQRVADRRRAVEGGDDDGNLRPPEVRRERGFGERPGHRVEGGLRRSIARRQPKGPVFDQVLSMVPFVRPREDDDARAS